MYDVKNLGFQGILAVGLWVLCDSDNWTYLKMMGKDCSMKQVVM